MDIHDIHGLTMSYTDEYVLIYTYTHTDYIYICNNNYVHALHMHVDMEGIEVLQGVNPKSSTMSCTDG